MARWMCVLMALWLAGCASHPVVTKSEQLFDDTLFKPASERINAADALALTDEMRTYLQREMGNLMLRRDPQRVLLEHLYTHNQLQLRYDTEMTRSAAQAFAVKVSASAKAAAMRASVAAPRPRLRSRASALMTRLGRRTRRPRVGRSSARHGPR